MSYIGHSLEESYPSAEMQSVYSAAPANWDKNKMADIFFIFFLHKILNMIYVSYFFYSSSKPKRSFYQTLYDTSNNSMAEFQDCIAQD